MNRHKILIYFKKHKIAKTSELISLLGNKMAIIRLANEGVLQQIARGYYTLPKFDIFSGLLILIAKYYTHGIVSGLMAAKYYDITDESIDRIDVDIVYPHNIRNDLLKVKRIQPKRLVGVKKVTIKGYSVKIYNLERTLIDVYLKYERGIFYKVLKRAQAKYSINVDAIKRYDAVLKTTILHNIMQELADA